MKKKRTKEKFFKALSLLLMTAYFTWRIVFAFPTEYGAIAIVAAIVMLICELASTIEAFVHMWASKDMREPEMPVIPEEWYPDVDVFIATHNESTDILYKTINGCKHMLYPDKSKVHIWICDDGYRMEMKELAEKMNVGWQGLQNNKLAKAGNLNNALAHTSAPLIVTFDADMIPTRDFLMETVPYFFMPRMKKLPDGTWVEKTPEEIDPNDKIGFIQTPQNFYNADLFQYNLYSEEMVPNEQDYFFREINVSRNNTNSPIYAGSNTVISREALEEVGGIATGTITEDFETGIHIQGKGYKCYAVSKVVAHGLAPDTVESLLKQRERWGRGCIYSLRKMHIWTNKEIPFKSKINYWACELYWWTFIRRFIFILSPILFSVFSIPVIICKPWELLAFWLPSYLVFNYTQNLVASNIRTTKWSNVIDTIMFPYLIIPILMEAVGIQQHKFHVTRKDRVISESDDLVLAIPHAILLVFSILAIFFCFGDMVNYQTAGGVIMIYWMIINAYSLLMAIFFMKGRNNKRMTERYQVSIPAVIYTKESRAYGETADISESGMSIKLHYAKNIPDEPVKIILRTECYEATVIAKHLHTSEAVDEEGERFWKYSFVIVEMTNHDKDEYFQIVYDRQPSLPSVTVRNDGYISTILANVNNRASGVQEQKRKQIRVSVNRRIKDESGIEVFLYDYNGSFILVDSNTADDRKNLSLILGEAVVMQCEYDHNIDKDRSLYRITNEEELTSSIDFASLLSQWIFEEREGNIS